jgi:hypothetical protein
VTTKGLFAQNVIAVVWDFDRTLSPHYMQKPLFDDYGIDEARFWAECNALPAFYEKASVRVHPETCYLTQILSYVQAGLFDGLTNARLRELGGRIEFFPGVPEILVRLAAIPQRPEFQAADIRVEHYVVSTGLAEMIRGSALFAHLDGVWASEFIEVPAGPGADLQAAPGSGPISQIAYFLDNTTKTRALFEINKGVNKERRISVNDSIAEDDRRVPFRNMIYVADGPSDVPSFSVVKKHGGCCLAVFNPESPKADEEFAQVSKLLEDKRVDFFGPADYRPNSVTDRWLRMKVEGIARRIVEERLRTLETRVSRSPHHIADGEEQQLQPSPPA